MSVILLLITVTLGYFCFDRTTYDPNFYNLFVFFCLFILFTVFLIGTIAYIKDFLSSQFHKHNFYLFSMGPKTSEIHVHQSIDSFLFPEKRVYSYNDVQIRTPILEVSTDNFFRRLRYCLLNTTPDRIYWRFKLSGNCMELRNYKHEEERLRIPYADAVHFVSYFQSFTELIAVCDKLSEVEQTVVDLKKAQQKDKEKLAELRKALARKKKLDLLKLKAQEQTSALK